MIIPKLFITHINKLKDMYFDLFYIDIVIKWNL
jgi:hypothetical protein